MYPLTKPLIHCLLLEDVIRGDSIENALTFRTYIEILDACLHEN